MLFNKCPDIMIPITYDTTLDSNMATCHLGYDLCILLEGESHVIY